MLFIFKINIRQSNETNKRFINFKYMYKTSVIDIILFYNETRYLLR